MQWKDPAHSTSAPDSLLWYTRQKSFADLFVLMHSRDPVTILTLITTIFHYKFYSSSRNTRDLSHEIRASWKLTQNSVDFITAIRWTGKSFYLRFPFFKVKYSHNKISLSFYWYTYLIIFPNFDWCIHISYDKCQILVIRSFCLWPFFHSSFLLF